MKMLWAFCVIFLGCFFDICYARGVNLGLCDDTFFNCVCGKSDFRVRTKVKTVSIQRSFNAIAKNASE
ncbi:hypothetical protein CEXT_618241 [Caerostris extrusa]|uniref:Uncharacterized protein n=1 Tax=Caerostris extrusa TaxID=172846 RepID=A0AAV4MPI9_CAEEX|nr:hypothetical protein CEXT_618241 [Caerostris extrusa]